MTSSSQMPRSIQTEIKSMSCNSFCVDCGAKNPQWASVSYGTLFCLECSVTMDAWSESQIEIMRLGGNEKMLNWFEKHNVPRDASIHQKYNSPAAELYRLRLKAFAEGREPPSELPKRAKKTEARATVSKDDETPIERELRLREEARERLRAKFGSGGLKGVSVSSHPMPKMNDEEQGFNSELLQKKGEAALKSVTTAFSALSTTAWEATNKAAQKLKDSEITKKMQDPENIEKIKQKTVESWTAISTTATSLWTKVNKNGGDSIWESFNEITKVERRSVQENRSMTEEEEARLEEEAKERLRMKFGDKGISGNNLSSGQLQANSFQNPTGEKNQEQQFESKTTKPAKEEDDDAWLLEQLANTKVPPRSSSTPPELSTLRSKQKKETSEAPGRLTPSTKLKSPLSSGAPKSESKKPKSVPMSGDDFFSSFGVS